MGRAGAHPPITRWCRCDSERLLWQVSGYGDGVASGDKQRVRRYEVLADRPIEIECVPDGPALVRFASALRGPEGDSVDVERPLVAVCNCGFSRRKPWCDGSHRLAPDGLRRPVVLTVVTESRRQPGSEPAGA
ncbi:MAG: CDGSH iron-sulfur domain-containing protein [Aeromicrobium sp.]